MTVIRSLSLLEKETNAGMILRAVCPFLIAESILLQKWKTALFLRKYCGRSLCRKNG